VARLVDTNILVYRFDSLDPVKQRRASALLGKGITDGSLRVAHQSILEFVAAVTRPRKVLDGRALLTQTEALLEAELLCLQLPVLYPSREVLATAMRGATMYGLPWFDAQIWATAEVHGLDELLSEDFQHGRHYGSVRAVNPFLAATGVHELPALYEAPAPRRKSPA
jgi:predicted nucleic acid-binding protein